MSNAFTLYVAPLLVLFLGRIALDAIYFQYVIPDVLPDTVRAISGQDLVASRKKYGLLTFLILTASSYFNVLFHHALDHRAGRRHGRGLAAVQLRPSEQ